MSVDAENTEILTVLIGALFLFDVKRVRYHLRSERTFACAYLHLGKEHSRIDVYP